MIWTQKATQVQLQAFTVSASRAFISIDNLYDLKSGSNSSLFLHLLVHFSCQQEPLKTFQTESLEWTGQASKNISWNTSDMDSECMSASTNIATETENGERGGGDVSYSYSREYSKSM